MWVLGTELRSQGLVASTILCWAISYAPCGKYFTGDLLAHLTIPIIVYLDYFQFLNDCKHHYDKHLEYKSSAGVWLQC